MELPATTDNFSDGPGYSWPSRISVSNLDVFFTNMYKVSNYMN